MSDFCLNTQEINNAANLCEDPDTKGFDLEAGQSWIYPTNYPVRDYQYNIIQEALHKNTLVSLPTGLGKTFIAAVVMYNFYRWYPHGKVIFMAPTRPLVEQQIDACYNIMAIPREVTAELTGVKKAQGSRAEVWESKRVFFITPQVLQNDLENVLELGNKIKCLVFDEAHRAKGNYAYCEVIRKLLPKNRLFRVLALSATPGNSVKDIGEVMQNLLISHLEFRNEESADVKDYVFERSLETVVVPLGDKLQQVKEDYEQILEKYARTLIKYKVVHGNFSNLTKGKIHIVKKEFQARNRGSGTPHYSEIMKTLNICLTLYHGYEALVRCGLRIFLSYFEEHISNPLLTGNTALLRIMEELREYLGPSPEVECLPDGSFAQIPASTKFGHPKFYRLRNILVAHFSSCAPSSRVIVFFEYKESVKEALAVLCQAYPTVKPRVFVGQGAGVRQKDQILTVRAFRQGSCNTLLSTCIGEEGLDVGEVDLIVCFDTTNKSPIRMIQRMGRTGRKKQGRIVVLVTEGKEQQTVKDSLVCRNNLGSVMANSAQLDAAKYKDSPAMIPSYVKPSCRKMFITVKKPALSKNSSLKDMFRNMSRESPRFFDDVDVKDVEERIKSKTEVLWDKEDPLSFDFQEGGVNFSRHLEKQRVFQSGGEVKQSKQTEIFVRLLQSADSKRFNIPVTQTFSRFNGGIESKNLKQSDIRSMFSKPNPVDVVEGLLEPCMPLSQIYSFEKEKEKEKESVLSYPEELFQEISDYLAIRASTEDECRTCTHLFKCPKMRIKSDPIDLSSWVVPDLSILDTITARDLEVFADSLSTKSKQSDQCLESNNDIFDDILFTQLEKSGSEETGDKPEEKSFAYETPKTFEKILNSFRVCGDNDSQSELKKNEDKSLAYERPKSFGKVLDSFKDYEDDVFLPPETGPSSREVKGANSYEEILSFFKLSSLKDLFLDEILDKSAESDKTLIYTPETKSVINNSPDIFEESPDLFQSSEKKKESPVEASQSPILCSYERADKLMAKKKLFNEDECFASQISRKPNLSKLKLSQKSFYEPKSTSPRKSNPEPCSKQVCLEISELDISDICDLSNFGLDSKMFSKNEKKEERAKSPTKSGRIDLDISDVCDLSIFGISTVDKAKIEEKTVNKNTESKCSDGAAKKNMEEALDIEDICDISDFLGNVKKGKNEKIISEEKTVKANAPNDNVSQNEESVKTNTEKELSIDDICDISDFLSEPVSKKRCESQRKTKSQLESVISNDNKKLSVSDFCDLDLDFEDEHFGTKEIETLKVKKITQKEEKGRNKNINHVNENVRKEPKENNDIIDLTDSPEKSITTQPAKKVMSQLSITQMLSLVSKTEDPQNSKSSSQKENSTCSTPKPKRLLQKSILSLSNSKKRTLQPKQNLQSPSEKPKNETSKTKNKFNLSLALNSDDEFEECTVSPIFVKPKPVIASNSAKKNKSKNPVASKRKKPKKLFCEYIEEEAVLSDTDNVTVSEDEESDEDCFEASFVNDETESFFNSTDMHAQYLKTIKSPSVRGNFKIPSRLRHNVTNVFSQEVNNEDDTYVNDSFCVSTQEVDSPKRHELSELELLEMKLKSKKKDKKRKSDDKSAINTKRRRIISLNDDSD